MGYTHYWDHPDITPAEWHVLMADVRLIVRASDVPLAGPMGTGILEITPAEIAFNGVDPDDYESFVLTPESTDFDFCKTARRPYDAVVGAVLLVAYATVTGFSVRSDGDIAGDDWADARDLYRRAFNTDAPEVIG